MSYVTGISGNVISAASAGWAPTNSAEVSAIASAYATGKQDALTFGYDADDKISAINNSGLVDTDALHSADYSSLYVQEPLYISASGDSSYIGISGDTQVVTAVGTETAYTPDGVSDVVTSINGNYISALSADSAWVAEYDDRGRLLTSLASEYDISSIASSYAESAVSAVSGDYYSTSNPSGFITSAPFDSATCSAIASSYAESAVSSKADSSALSSYALSADVSGTVDLVSSQSANWGGSALALSAGPGVKLEKVGDTLVASTDETVLWSGANASSAQLSESYTNFERLSFVVGFPAQAGHVLTFDVGSMATAFNLLFPFGSTYAYFCNAKASFTTTDTVQVSDAKYVYSPFGTSTQVTSETSNVNNTKTCLQKIIGIRRTAEA